MKKRTLALKVLPTQAEAARKDCAKRGVLSLGFKIEKSNGYIYMAVKEKFSSNYSFVQKKLETLPQKKSLKDCLKDSLSKREQEVLKTSMDVIGRVAIIEIPDELNSKEKLIAQEVLRSSKNIKTVLKKGRHQGRFRAQKLKHLGGNKTKVAVCKENNIILKVDVEKVYFSPRLSSERGRIANLVRKGETVLVMFSGCGPYTCVIAKNSLAKRVIGVEINPAGHKYSLENIRLNKLDNATSICGDAKKIVPELTLKFDRIIMPLPSSAEKYLGTALLAAKNNAIIHFYDFELESEVKKGILKFEEACSKAGKQCKLLEVVKTAQTAPRAYRYCFDFKVE